MRAYLWIYSSNGAGELWWRYNHAAFSGGVGTRYDLRVPGCPVPCRTIESERSAEYLGEALATVSCHTTTLSSRESH